VSAEVRPPRWAESLLRRSLPPGLSRDGVLGDLEEELAERAARSSASAARRWYARQAIAVAARLWVAKGVGRGFGGLFPLDVGAALRSLRHAPSFVALTTLTLALGVGATTAIFSVVDGVLIRPLPYSDPDRLVVSKVTLSGDLTDNHSEPEIFDLMGEREIFEVVAAYRESQPLLGGGTEPERVRGVLASAGLFDVLGVEPLLGRVYTEEEDRAIAPTPAPGSTNANANAGPSASPERVAVLSYGLWMRAFAADSAIIGKTVLFENVPNIVIGVMPPGFSFPSPGVEVWRPLRMDPVNPVARNNHYLRVIARLAERTSLAAANTRLDSLGASSTTAYPEFYSQRMGYTLTPLYRSLVGDVRAPLLMLMGAVVLVLLIAAVNAASLFLARGHSRRAELAVRTALGAARGRVAGQLLAESLIVAGLAGAIGVALAYGGVALLRELAPANLPRIEQVEVDARVLLVGLGVALATGLVFGLAPATQAWRSDVRAVLAAGGRGGTGGDARRGRFRRGLVVTQLALATVLALGAALLLRSFAELRSIQLGFDPDRVAVFPLAPHASALAQNEPAVAFYQQLEERVAALPGVTAVGSGLRIPLASGHDNYSIQIEGREVATIGESPAPGMEWATPGYFDALGIPLLRGRLFTAADNADAPPVAVIGEGTARDLWPGEDALGKRLRMYNETAPWTEVVGIVADVKHNGVREEPSHKLYIPHLQGFQSGYYSPANLNVFVRTVGDPSLLIEPVRATIRALEPRMPIGAVRTMNDVVDGALAADRFTLVLLAGFAAGALLLAAVGVYGVVAEGVLSRTREIGLRMAVGAARTRILRQVMLEGIVLAGWGAALGLAGGLLLARGLESVLYEVSPADPWAYVAAAPILFVVVLAASLIPALRAARLDPMDALRGG
jgi:putative ABC transport system permease protein